MKGSKKNDKRAKEQDTSGESTAAQAASESKALTEEELKTLREKAQKAEEYQDRHLRALAELDNYRKRAAKDRAQAVEFAQMQIVRGLLPIIDNLERAVAQLKNPAGAQGVQEGLDLIDRQLITFLESIGLKPIECVGQPFDPHLHEAVQHVPSSDHPDHTVLEEIQKGYRLHERVLRHALVKVVDNPVTPGEEKKEEKAADKKDNE